MPDLDRVERTLSPHWRVPYRLIKGGHSAELVGEALIRGVAAEIRKQGGVPEFGPFLQVYLAPEQRPESLKTLADVGRAIEQSFGQSRDAKLLSQTMQRTRAKIEAGRALPSSRHFAEEFFGVLLRHHFFAKVTHRIVGVKRRFTDVTEARAFEHRVYQVLEPQIAKLARRFVADPTSSTLRAPKSLRPRLSTAELLDTPI
jgi:hypothetical protein